VPTSTEGATPSTVHARRKSSDIEAAGVFYEAKPSVEPTTARDREADSGSRKETAVSS